MISAKNSKRSRESLEDSEEPRETEDQDSLEDQESLEDHKESRKLAGIKNSCTRVWKPGRVKREKIEDILFCS
jgi:hypothetical protein